MTATSSERFSVRMGLVPRKALQADSMDPDLRNSLWNVIWGYASDLDGGKQYDLAHLLWVDYFKLPLDDFPRWASSVFVDSVGPYVTKTAEWHEVYDIIEFLDRATNGALRSKINNVLARESSSYRLSMFVVVPLTNSTEIAAIEQAAGAPGQARMHISEAVRLFATRPTPDYRNSMKESISAVEALCKGLSRRSGATLPQALSHLESKIQLHAQWRQALLNLYNYSSDEDGIRHGAFDPPSISQEDARFMLVTCSAFVNYLLEKARMAGVDPESAPVDDHSPHG